MDTMNGLSNERTDEYGREYDSMVTISPAQLLKVIRIRIVLIIAAALLFALFGVYRSNPIGETQYKVTASVIYDEEEASAKYLPGGVSPLTEQLRRTKAYAKLYTEHNVIDLVVNDLSAEGINTNYSAITNNLKAEASEDVPVISLSMTGTDEQFLLKAMGHLVDHKDEVMFGDHTEGEAEVLSAPSSTAIKTSSKGLIKNAILYGVLGTVLAIAALVCAEIFRILTSRAIQSEKELAAVMNCPVLAVVPMSGDKKSKRTGKEGLDSELNLISASSKPQYIEAFMMLRTNLINSIDRLEGTGDKDRDGKVIMITSCLPKEGKTNTSANLASVLSASGCKVLLADVNFRNRTLSNAFGFGAEHKGVLDVLHGNTQASEAIIPLQDRQFDFMPACGAGPNPIEGVDIRKLRALFDDLRAKYELIIVDADSVNTSAEPSEIGKLCDGCITVVTHANTSRGNVCACREQLNNSSIPVLGAVLNQYDSLKDSSATITKYYS